MKEGESSHFKAIRAPLGGQCRFPGRPLAFWGHGGSGHALVHLVSLPGEMGLDSRMAALPAAHARLARIFLLSSS